MDSDELVDHLQKILDVEVPKGTLRRWAWQGLIPAPKPIGRKGERGRFVSWPLETVEQAAAVYVVRHTDVRWAKTTKDALLAAKDVADHFYATINKFVETGDTNTLLKLNHFLKPAKAPLFASDGGVGWHGGFALHPLVVTWIATLEKIRHNQPVYEPMSVRFHWNYHLVIEGGQEILKIRYDGVTLAPFVCDSLGQQYGHTPAAFEKRRGKKPTDWEKDKSEGNVLTFGQNTDWDNVKFDVKNQRISVTDPFKKSTTVIDLKSYGLMLISRDKTGNGKKNEV
ncbi:MAG: hypothetical protein WCG09_03220 [Halobacteriota archaeon]